MDTLDPVIRAIDVGYGNTKYTTAVHDGQTSAAHFHSIVHRPSPIEGSFSESDQIYDVVVRGERYQVGPGLDVVWEGGVRTLHDNFIETNGYMALVYGALSQMDIDDHIDLLVVGLPVALMNSKRQKLQAMLQGTHTVMGREITIHRVNAVAQPLGGFMSFAGSDEDQTDLSTTRNFLIDPGFFTVDFMASTGLREIKGFSGSHSSGVSAYLKGIAKALSKDMGEPIEDISLIDAGLISGRFKQYGKEVDLSQYHDTAIEEIMPAVEVISNKIGAGRNVDQVILVGGGAKLFLEPLQNILTNHSIICPENSILSNVLGFQQIGEMWFQHQQREVA